MTADPTEIRRRVEDLARDWRGQRAERQARRQLVRADVGALHEAGFLRLGVPVEQGGTWASAAASTRGVCETLRSLAGADSSLALVFAMHPAVLGFWLAHGGDVDPAWDEQRRAVFATAAAGSQWGTITSEPGSGGDIGKTRAIAEPVARGARADPRGRLSRLG